MKLKQGENYLFTVIDFDDNKREFIGEFRGYEENIMIIWEENDTCGREYDLCDVVRAIRA